MSSQAPPAVTASGQALTITALTKTFAAVRALDSVDLSIPRGEVHALLGENGSGKSTLIKILSGYHVPDEGGQVLIDGVPLPFGSPAASHQRGARFVHQDLGLVESASINDNLAYGTGFPTRFGAIRSGASRQRARLALERVELDLSPEAIVETLSPAQKTGIAVARALVGEEEADAIGGGGHLLVLDEPTARLPEHEVEHLLAIVRSVARKGIAVLYVTHRLDEVFTIANRATILRDGKKVASTQVAGLTRDVLLHHLLGAALEQTRRVRAEPARDARPVLSVQGLRSEVLRGVSLDVHAGEIVGVAGITGSGREALCATVFGARERDGGEVQIAGGSIKAERPKRAMALGAAYIPAERKLEGAFMDLSAQENITVSSLWTFWRRLTLRGREEGTVARLWFDRLGIRPRGEYKQSLSLFSGGNQQKVVFGKWLQRKPLLFLLDEPTQGVDVGAKAELHLALFDAAASGAGVLMSSSDVDELVSTCDRVVVLRAGRLAAELTGDDINPHALSRASLGTDKSAEGDS